MGPIRLYYTHALRRRDTIFLNLYAKEAPYYSIHLVNSMEESTHVLYLFNMGENCFNDSCKHYYPNDRYRWSIDREWRNIKSIIRVGKKVIIYVRDDGAGLIDSLLRRIVASNYQERVIIIKDFCFSEAFIQEAKDKPFTSDDGGFYYHLSQILDAFPDIRDARSGKFIQGKPDPALWTYYSKINIFTFRFSNYGWLLQNYDQGIVRKTTEIFFVKNDRPTIDGMYREKIRRTLIERFGDRVKTKLSTGETYIDSLAKSKIVVSAWGLGESNYDDWKSTQNRAILIRPRSDHIRDYYGIYGGHANTIREFSVDLKNIEYIVQQTILFKDFFLSMAHEYHDHLSKFDLKRHAADFSEILTYDRTLAN